METIKKFSSKYYSVLWNSIDFEKTEEDLKALQRRLSVVAENRNRAMVRCVSDLITESLEIKALAVKKVTGNTFHRPGIDGTVWKTPEEKMKGAMSLDFKDYAAQPFRRIIITDKKKMKERHIGVLTIKDKAMQALYSFVLNPILEATADKKSFAFRKGRSSMDVHHFICEALKYPHSPEWVLVTDVKSCYESISHDWIMCNIPMNKKVLRSFLKAGFILKNEFFPTETGISLGMSISPIIANMVLDGMQKAIVSIFPKSEIPDYGNGNFIRYADDIFVTARNKETAEQIKSAISRFLAIRGLCLSETKTKIVNVNEGFDFLSRNYCKRDGILCSTPSEKAVKSFEKNIEYFLLSKGKSLSQRDLIKELNAKLIGFASYHRVEQSKDVFRHIDCLVSSLLLKLLQNIFPKRTKKQIIDKYWYEESDGTKTFALLHRKDIKVVKLKDTILITHDPVILKKNPYIDTDYFESRLNLGNIQKVNGKYKSVWERQKGKCYYCGRKIYSEQNKKLINLSLKENHNVLDLAYIHEFCFKDEAEFIHAKVDDPSEADVFKIVEDIKKSERNKRNKDFLPLKEYFCNCKKNKILIKFTDIKNILKDVNLKNLNDESFWYADLKPEFKDAWLSEGYNLVEVNFKKEIVSFEKINKSTSKLEIPPVILSNKLPNNAKYEIEQFFKYIMKKYGI